MDPQLKIVCSQGSEASQFCVERGCHTITCMCHNACECHNDHPGHPTISIVALRDSLSDIPQVIDRLQGLHTEINLLISTLEASLTQLRQAAKLHFEQQLKKYSDSNSKRQDLLSDSTGTLSKLTGDQLSQILAKLKCEIASQDILTPSSNQFMAVAQIARRKVEEAVQSVSSIWNKKANPAIDVFRSRLIDENYILGLPRDVAKVSLDLSFSTHWRRIGQAMSRLSHLSSLALNDCDSGDVLCDSIKTCKRLRQVRMTNCRVTDQGVDRLSQHPQLLELNLDHNESTLTVEGFKTALRKMKKLRQLKMRLPAIKTLQIDGLKVGNKGAQFIAQNLPSLSFLDLDNNDVGEPAAMAIAKGLKHLEWLSLNDNHIGDQGVKTLCRGLPCLTKIVLSDAKIGIKALTEICKIERMKQLNVGFNPILDEGAILIGKNLPNLTWLNIRKCGVTHKGVEPIVKGLQVIKHFFVDGNDIGHEGAEMIAGGMPRLEKLDIGGNRIGQTGAVALIKGLSRLRQLFLDTNQIGEQEAIQAARNLSNLILFSAAVNSIGDRGALYIFMGMPKLSKINLQKNCLTEKCQNQLRSTFRKIDKLIL